MVHHTVVNTLRPRQSRRHFADDIFKCIFLNENAGISLKISLKFVPKVRINNIPALVQIMAWRRPGDKPLSEPRMVSLLTHICATRPQWVNEVIEIPSSHGQFSTKMLTMNTPKLGHLHEVWGAYSVNVFSTCTLYLYYSFTAWNIVRYPTTF